MKLRQFKVQIYSIIWVDLLWVLLNYCPKWYWLGLNSSLLFRYLSFSLNSWSASDWPSCGRAGPACGFVLNGRGLWIHALALARTVPNQQLWYDKPSHGACDRVSYSLSTMRHTAVWHDWHICDDLCHHVYFNTTTPALDVTTVCTAWSLEIMAQKLCSGQWQFRWW